jgi:peptidoglycan/xylan/chitin deacetylase (PgdA/CDA1 family)
MQLAPLYPVLYRVLHPLFPTCLWAGDHTTPVVALTFDDGPHPEYTGQLLKILDYYQVPASFFWLGACVQRSPSLARTIYEQGHGIGLHGYDHRSFPLLSSRELQQTLWQTQVAIAEACDVPPDAIRDVRPPNGLFTPQTLKLLHEWNYRPVMWSVVPEDWTAPGIATVITRILRQVTNGSVIVLHDGRCGGHDVAAITAQLIPKLLEKEFRFVTIDQLWQQRSLNPCFNFSQGDENSQPLITSTGDSRATPGD